MKAVDARVQVYAVCIGSNQRIQARHAMVHEVLDETVAPQLFSSAAQPWRDIGNTSLG